MRRSIRAVDLALWPAVAAVLFGPVLVGAFNVFPAALLAALLLLLCLYAFSPLNRSARAAGRPSPYSSSAASAW